ncbi:O-antigen polymerase [Rhodobacter capsulatus]|uniref:O-antigen polymerase n=1 Tax=Rhodobacter capsulatus TaxID=1061 RepID=UPI001142A5FB|nr:O-antigen polymerase [Rhodobacter capsulatus]TQD32394.1 oligosaccharide repeat unit polymerase [Rhodobacter capsulatus]
MHEFDFFAYLTPLVVLIFSLVIFYNAEAMKNSVAFVLVSLWAVAFLSHGVVSFYQIVPIYPSGLVANLFLSGAVLSLSWSFVFWRKVLSYARGADYFNGGCHARELVPQVSNLILPISCFFSALVFLAMYMSAVRISGTYNVIGSLGAIRVALNYGGASWGGVDYFALPVLIIGIYLLVVARENNSKSIIYFIPAIFSIAISVVSTQRSSIFMTLIAIAFSLSERETPKIKTIAVGAVVLTATFISMGLTVGKISGDDDGILSAIEFGLNSMCLYFLTPISAFNDSEIYWNSSADLGYSLRFPMVVLDALGLYSGEISNKIQPFINVPMPTNVYTFGYISISDFGSLFPVYYFLLGAILAIIFSLPRRIVAFRVLQGISFYPVLMTVFQDQFAILTSLWIQVLVSVFICHLFTSYRPRHDRMPT